MSVCSTETMPRTLIVQLWTDDDLLQWLVGSAEGISGGRCRAEDWINAMRLAVVARWTHVVLSVRRHFNGRSPNDITPVSVLPTAQRTRVLTSTDAASASKWRHVVGVETTFWRRRSLRSPRRWWRHRFLRFVRRCWPWTRYEVSESQVKVNSIARGA